ncbi:probable blue pigment (indigoidine) exporter [Microbacterium sp. RU33B]|nr:probable blue pigment (indigoidine) exporter [Microbacterium sp. RU33B]
MLRALPAGLIVLLLARRLPRGAWWWRSLVLGTLNVGGSFVLIYIAGQRLPSSTAATLMSTSAACMMLFAWAMLRQRPRLVAVIGAAIGLVGVGLMLGLDGGGVDPWGVAASLGAMTASSLGFVLTVRWGEDVAALPMAAWQLLGGSVVLVPVALIVEGAPPVLTLPSTLGFAYVTLVATALAYAAWFAGLRHLQPGPVGIIGLLNPVTGVALGVLIAGEAFGLPQAVGMALVLGGIILGSLPSRRPRAAAVITLPLSPPSLDVALPVGMRPLNGREGGHRRSGSAGMRRMPASVTPVSRDGMEACPEPSS